MNMRLPSKKFFVGMLSVLAAIAILLTVVPAAYAEGSSPFSPIPGFGRIANEALVRMHKTEVGWFNDQEALIKQTNELSAKFQTLIDAQAKAGKNVTMLQDALATFDAEITAGTEIHAQAGNIIFMLVGWTSGGDVRDRLAAGQSLTDARAALQDANFRLTRAMPALEKAFAAWRASRIHWDLPTRVPTATPH